MSGLVLALVLALTLTLAVALEASDTYRWNRRALGRSRRDAMRHAAWRAGL
jgi:hypothetical protein